MWCTKHRAPQPELRLGTAPVGSPALPAGSTRMYSSGPCLAATQRSAAPDARSGTPSAARPRITTKRPLSAAGACLLTYAPAAARLPLSTHPTDAGLACGQRVERRHAATGKPPEVAATRVRDNDGPNALLIASTAHHADVLVPSLPLPLAAAAAAPAAAAATTAATAAAPDGSSSEAQLDERLEDRRSWIEKFNDNRAA